MRLFVLAALVLAAGVGLLLAACAGSDGGPPAILLVSTRDGDYAIYGMAADGEDQSRLTEESGDPSTAEGLFFQTEPAWSPDGTRIAFASRREGSFDIYVMDASGDGTTRLTSTKDDDTSPSWSPDGRRIVFSRGVSGDLVVMNADGSEVRQLLAGRPDDRQPDWSPDGRWVAFTRRMPGTPARELWVVRSDGSAARQLTSLDSLIDGPAWSPDGRRVAFATDNRTEQFDIYSVAADGSDPRRFTTSTAEQSFEPAWSPDGATIAWSEGGSIVSKPFAGGRADETEQLTDPSGNDSSPAWRPTSEDAPG